MKLKPYYCHYNIPIIPITLFIMLPLLFILFSSATYANLHSKQQKLSKVNINIKRMHKSLRKAQRKRQNLQRQLQQTELRLSKFAKTLRHTDQNITRQRSIIKGLTSQLTQLNLDLSQQQASLAKQFRGAYMLSRQHYLKIILNQQDPARFTRMLNYYHYLNQASIDDIKSYLATQQRLQDTITQTQRHQHKLQQLYRSQKHQLTKFKTSQHHRKIVLASLRKQIHNKHQQLVELIRDKRQLTQLIKKLRRQRLLAATSFAKMRGHLAWPTKGILLAKYGSRIDQSSLRYNGVLIKAPLGQPIHAINDGRVIFAHWLKGFGLLLIIDHGHGYMTLYGRNQSIYKKVGDRIKTGDLIATVGRSGGFNTPALYFAIRYRGKPLNPSRWCR